MQEKKSAGHEYMVNVSNIRTTYDIYLNIVPCVCMWTANITVGIGMAQHKGQPKLTLSL